jgi:hypothetical protein
LTGLFLIAGDEFEEEADEGVGEDGLGEDGWYAGRGSSGRGMAGCQRLIRLV